MYEKSMKMLFTQIHAAGFGWWQMVWVATEMGELPVP